MANYYIELQRAYRWLEKALRTSTEEPLTTALLIYQCTQRFPVPAKAIERRIALMVQAGKVVDYGEAVMWKAYTNKYETGKKEKNTTQR